MTEQILFVCTANICRSPMAEALLRDALQGRNHNVDARSAGFITEGRAADKKARLVLARLGIDVSAHVSATVESVLTEQTDLVLTMAREHLRSLSKLSLPVRERSFTLKEFVFLGGTEGERRPGELLADYVDRVGAGRTLSATTSLGAKYDIEDPMGRRKSAFVRCVFELQALVEQLVDLLYPHSTTEELGMR